MHKSIMYREFKFETVEAGKRFVQVVVPRKMRERVSKLMTVRSKQHISM